ncbi:hypothetical protein DICVIV_13728 [Dictyocaulus viviparus]|uniref:Uncharacterized protein n=1 Tax=Dictyocaulus viviparus TaxID=29172 RepID=A0A0D8X9M4_DICVI|nr:hypothetical protein DICVIV_13728 [Dictyocaulus viviparus]
MYIEISDIIRFVSIINRTMHCRRRHVEIELSNYSAEAFYLVKLYLFVDRAIKGKIESTDQFLLPLHQRVFITEKPLNWEDVDSHHSYHLRYG